ncbi:hypothetical protein PR003_g12118 [Phytophthora rubi]|uniref:Uncharacterized protein n=1 Tax=Phytophthora rubi TaxID=129364 RepID=A0A6A3LYC1_9STRA|nr:hypothetical protein PR002_g12401 [Phytophthora rubi]KAE9337214.1 hypothetical protein PR003_g12118 [Phytophthora rubi]
MSVAVMILPGVTLQSGSSLGMFFCRWCVSRSHDARTGHAHHRPDRSRILVSPWPL